MNRVQRVWPCLDRRASSPLACHEVAPAAAAPPRPERSHWTTHSPPTASARTIATSAGVHPSGGKQALDQQRGLKALTPSDWRLLIGLAAAAIILCGFVAFVLVANPDDARTTLLVNVFVGVPTGLLCIWILRRSRKDHGAIAQHAESIYRRALIEDPGNKALARSLQRSLRMQSEFAQAKRRTLYILPCMAMLFGVITVGGLAGYEYGYAAGAASVVVQVLIIGAIRTAVRVVPAARMPARARDAARADLWHLTVGWLRTVGIVAVMLAILSLARMPGDGPIVFPLILGFAAVTLIAAHRTQRWIGAAPALATDISKAAEDESAAQGLLAGNDTQSSQSTNYSRGSRWAAELLQSTPASRTLRINLVNVHVLEVCITRWRGIVKLDGEIVVRKLCSDVLFTDPGRRGREPTNADAWYIVNIDDGGGILPAEITVTKNRVKFSWKIIKLSLRVRGNCLYSE
jgi:hypothetical protein